MQIVAHKQLVSIFRLEGRQAGSNELDGFPPIGMMVVSLIKAIDGIDPAGPESPISKP